MKKTINIRELFGVFCSNGEHAAKYLSSNIIPLVSEGDTIVFDFDGVRNMNSSFANALFANLIMRQGLDVLNLISFNHCHTHIRILASAALERGIKKFKEK